MKKTKAVETKSAVQPPEKFDHSPYYFVGRSMEADTSEGKALCALMSILPSIMVQDVNPSLRIASCIVTLVTGPETLKEFSFDDMNGFKVAQ